MGCARRGELRGPGTPRNSSRDPCHRGALRDLGINREVADAVMELRLQGGVPAAQSGGRGAAAAGAADSR